MQPTRRVLILCCALWVVVATAFAEAPAKPWLFFDLGENSLLSTGKDRDGDLNAVAWMKFQGDDGKPTDALAYLEGLRAKGYPIGLIINIPEEWGDPDLSRANAWLAADPARRDELAAPLTASKMEALIDYFDGHGPGDDPAQKRRWTDATHPAFDFQVFTRGAVLFPFFTRFRKPMDGPLVSKDQLFLYQEALELATRQGRRAIYQCADPGDATGARKAGLTVRPLSFEVTRGIQRKGYYMNDAEIDALLRSAP